MTEIYRTKKNHKYRTSVRLKKKKIENEIKTNNFGIFTYSTANRITKEMR